MFNFKGEVLQQVVHGIGMKKANLEESLKLISSFEEFDAPMKELTSHVPRIVDELEYLELSLAEWENNQLDEETGAAELRSYHIAGEIPVEEELAIHS